MVILTDLPNVFRLHVTMEQKRVLLGIRSSARQCYNRAVQLFAEGKSPENYDFHAEILSDTCAFLQEHPYLVEIPYATRRLAVDEACVAQQSLQAKLQQDDSFWQKSLRFQERSTDYSSGFVFGLGPRDLRLKKNEHGKVFAIVTLAIRGDLILGEIYLRPNEDGSYIESLFSEADGRLRGLALIHRDQRDNWYTILR